MLPLGTKKADGWGRVRRSHYIYNFQRSVCDTRPDPEVPQMRGPAPMRL